MRATTIAVIAAALPVAALAAALPAAQSATQSGATLAAAHPWISILPPLIAIVLAILTRKVILSLGLGVLAAALLIANLNPLTTLKTIGAAILGLFYADGALNTDHIYILAFLALLGAITALVLMAGGSQAFSDWAASRIKGRRGAQWLGTAMGVGIFIDDYFNALAVGQVAKPVTDKYRVSRAKLAYIIDSTSAPVTVLVPFSSWGASIIALMAPTVAASGLAVTDIGAFMRAAAANYYAIAAVLLVTAVVAFSLDFGPMRAEERRAITAGRPYSKDADIPGEVSEHLPHAESGRIAALIGPFITLVIGVVGTMFVTGALKGGTTNVLRMLENTMVAESLVIGGLAGLAAALFFCWRAIRPVEHISVGTMVRGISSGAASMWPAIQILLLAWLFGDLIGKLGTGRYVGDLVRGADLPVAWLIPVMFLAASIMAFSTGTSWGSFGILIPIAGDIMNSLGATEFLLPALGAVLAGAVLGDHCSPISDTTILSSTGAGCDIITHVLTQLPYAGAAAIAALIGYTTLAATASIIAGLIATLIALGLSVVVLVRMTTTLEAEHRARREGAS